jgi:endopolyphosphatase
MIPPDQLKTFRLWGWFYREIVTTYGKLYVVSMNTLYWFVSNDAAEDCVASPTSAGSAHLLWLENLLRSAEKHGIPVILSGHVPPVKNAWFEGCETRYAKLVAQFHAVIKAQLFGYVLAISPGLDCQV